MAREKATISLDRAKVEEARALVSGRSMSDVIDLALDRLIRFERLRHDVAAYGRQPITKDDSAWGDLPVALNLDDDDVDYGAWYGQET